ncbi:glycosyltransferase family 4 protein [Winogradskyella sp.]|nr:glycosyltransferase family 4 protein [Winogradskyella sp.]
MKKLAIISTHPIQYNAPWFQLLGERKTTALKVFYTWSQAVETVKDKTFGREITWDVPLLEGYDYQFIENSSKNPGSHHFFGIDCPALILQLKAFNPDAILVFGWRFKSHLKVLSYFKGKIPIWFRGDSTLLDEVPGWKTSLRRLVLKQVYRYVDKAFYVGTSNKAYFLKHGLSEVQLIYAPHAVNNAHFFDDDQKHYETKAAQWKLDLGIPASQITVVFAGKFESKKQPNVLIDAVIAANQKRSHPLALVMIGNGPLEAQLKQQAEGQKHIVFLPFQNQSKMPLVYRMASIFCLPSKGPGETWGLAINEAMASSRPVIVSDKVGGAKDMLIDGYNGFCFPYSNPKALVALLETLSLRDLTLMGEHARAHVEKFSLEHIVEAIEHEVLHGL